ncbi:MULTISPECIES: IS630 transposase-related protein [unclassified Wolbachia]|uniref:IS630 transposase-related protein n=1 Tax=unclassified Wolbachia TaxID=2640676 RepID=UPI002226108F|nr:MULTISPECIES: IS630 transposase-related protein [unclassified Wolbachia]
MPAAYSYDLRKKAMEALDEGESRETVAARFKIGRTIAFLIIVRTGHRKAESTARRKDSNRGMFFLALFFIANQ